jgi:hypothetical protein
VKARSAAWDEAILDSHDAVTQVDVWLGGVPVDDAQNIRVRSGNVTADRGAAIRSRLTAALAEPFALPRSTSDWLAPVGYELFVQAGIRYRDGSTELLPCGVFPIQRSSIDDGRLTTVSTFDRAQLVIDARFEADYAVAGGTLYTSAISALVLAGVPWLTVNFPVLGYTVPPAGLVFPAQSDRWKAAQGMAKSIGCELYFDGLGRLSLLVEPSLSTAEPAWEIRTGERGALERLDVARDRKYVYNRVIAWSANPGSAALYTGIATDLDPASPTYYHGPFGHKPRFFVSEFLGSSAQAVAAAQGILNANLGLAAGFDLTTLPNAALEPGDAALIDDPELNIVEELHLVDATYIGLGAGGTMSIESRALQQEAA